MSKALFEITKETVQQIAIDRLGRKLTDDELHFVRKGIEFGLEYSWEVVVKTAIDEVVNYNDKE